MFVEPRVLCTVALSLADGAPTAPGQEGGPGSLPLLDCQKPQQRVLRKKRQVKILEVKISCKLSSHRECYLHHHLCNLPLRQPRAFLVTPTFAVGSSADQSSLGRLLSLGTGSPAAGGNLSPFLVLVPTRACPPNLPSMLPGKLPPSIPQTSTSAGPYLGTQLLQKQEGLMGQEVRPLYVSSMVRVQGCKLAGRLLLLLPA